MLQQGSGVVPIWDMASRKVTNLETNLKDPTILLWSKVGPQLAIGTAKGNLVIYRKDNRKKVPILGKHSKKIVAGAWSMDNKLTLGAEDNTITISNENGDAIAQRVLKHTPTDLQFPTFRPAPGGAVAAGGSARDLKIANTVSANLSGRTVLLLDIREPDNPIELAFNPRYGAVVAYRWFGDGYLVVAFGEGHVVIMSTLGSEINEELYSSQLFHVRRAALRCARPCLTHRHVTAGPHRRHRLLPRPGPHRRVRRRLHQVPGTLLQRLLALRGDGRGGA